MIRTLKYWVPVLLWAGWIFYLSSIPGLSSGFEDPWDSVLRKLAHFGMFAILDWLLFRVFRAYNVGLKRALLWSLILTILYAFSDEGHQYFVPGREANVSDVGIDALGGLLASYVLLVIQGRKEEIARLR